MNIDDANEGETALVPTRRLRITVNAVERAIRIEDRQLLVDVLRETLGLTGPKIGCYNGDCGACTVMIDGTIAKSCLMLAASAEGSVVTTIEGVSAPGNSTNCRRRFGRTTPSSAASASQDTCSPCDSFWRRIPIRRSRKSAKH